jgi:murein tripeptide amidase MpaA
MLYLNVQEIEWSIQKLADAYPSAAELIVTPNLTHEGRQTHVLRIGINPSATVDGVLILGGVHAREWVPPDALVSFAADLLEAYKLGKGLTYGGKKFLAQDVQHILEKSNLFIYPCVNPDGRYYSQTSDNDWRKNRCPHPSGGDCIGVDLNRNFNFLWDHLTKFSLNSDVRTSDNPCDKYIYRGTAPNSEPETQNVVWLLDSFNKIKWHIDVHSYSPFILHSWGDDQNQTTKPEQTFSNNAFDGVRGQLGDSDSNTGYGEYIPPEDLKLLQQLGERMNKAVKAVRGGDYPVDQAVGLYPTSGTSDDYAFSRHLADSSKPKVYGFTVECGRDFQPTWNEATEVILEVSAGLMEFCIATSS